MTFFAEAYVEAVAFSCPATVSWQVVHGPDIPNTIGATLTKEVT